MEPNKARFSICSPTSYDKSIQNLSEKILIAAEVGIFGFGIVVQVCEAAIPVLRVAIPIRGVVIPACGIVIPVCGTVTLLGGIVIPKIETAIL